MPKQVTDIKNFLEIARRKDARAARIKKTAIGPKQVQTKFKLRCSRYLYTLVVDDLEKANKLRQSLPPKMEIIEIGGKHVRGA
ncbi:60S ribosomal protein L38 [Malassezia vespertilionis]|uniref:60S ribosomal protein L38 n=1 Tax=Malassezia vespertilionis TaxID=2020962 RepID=UPI0024B25509|nr:60S ribosomal protein L38 [Malassezia vespertilionis]WFD08184.1 60S ribosomal protein L38 [Malassezia vespertilionis]